MTSHVPWLVLFASLIPVAASGQSTTTSCYVNGRYVNCNSYTAPNFAESFQQGYEMVDRAIESRARREQIDLQKRMLQMQIAEQQRRTQDRVNEEQRIAESARQQREAAHRELSAYWAQQVDACLRIELSQPDQRAETCVDTMLVTDPYFARAYAAAGSGSNTQMRLSAARAEHNRSLAKIEQMSDRLAHIEGCTPAQLRSDTCRRTAGPDESTSGN